MAFSSRWAVLVMSGLLGAGCGSSDAAEGTTDAAGDGAVDTSGTTDAAGDGAVLDTSGTIDAAGDTGGGGVDVSSSDGPILDDAPPGSCNSLLNDGTTVTVMQVASAMPTATGGSISPGTYHRTAWTRYTGVGGATGLGADTDKTTAFFGGGGFQIVNSSNGGPNQYSTGTYTTTASGGITLARSCPTVTTSPYVGFDATATQIVLYDPTGKQTLTYTRK